MWNSVAKYHLKVDYLDMWFKSDSLAKMFALYHPNILSGVYGFF